MKGSSYDTNDKNIDVSQMSSVLARLVHKIPTYLVKTLGFFCGHHQFCVRNSICGIWLSRLYPGRYIISKQVNSVSLSFAFILALLKNMHVDLTNE